jgi:hypothetical protein
MPRVPARRDNEVLRLAKAAAARAAKAAGSPPRARPRDLEHPIQAEAVRWARDNRHLDPRLDLLYAVPNGGARHKAVAGKMRAEGQRAGVPDLALPVAHRVGYADYIGLRIEVKAEGRPTQGQRWWLGMLAQEGHACFVCRSAEEIIAVIRWYLALDGTHEGTLAWLGAVRVFGIEGRDKGYDPW